MLVLEIGSTLDGHAAADMRRCLLDLLRREAEPIAKNREVPVVKLVVGEPELLFAEVFAEHEFVKDEGEFEGARKSGLEPRNRVVVKAFGFQGCTVDVRGFLKRTRTFSVRLDRLDLLVGVPELVQRSIHRLIDDLEVTAPGELLEI